MISPHRALLLAATFVFVSSPVTADQFSLMGTSSEAISQGSALTAGAPSTVGAYHNPAALGRATKQEQSLSYMWAKPYLSIDRTPHEATEAYLEGGAPAGREDEFNVLRYRHDVNRQLEQRAEDVPLIRGFHIGLALPFAEVREEADFVVGASIYVPQGPIMRQRVQSPDTPYFVEFDDRSQRIVVNAGVGYEITPRLRVGAGASMLANIDLNSTVFAAANMGINLLEQSFDLDVSITPVADIRVPPVISPIGGVEWDVSEKLTLAATFRDEIKTNFNGATNLSVAVGDARPVNVPIEFGASAAFTPRQAALGGQFRPTERARISADITWSQWSRYRPPVPEFSVSNIRGLAAAVIDGSGIEEFPVLCETIEITLADITIPIDIPCREEILDMVPSDVNMTYDITGFRDTFTPRLGLAYDLRENTTLMAGYFHRPSIIDPDEGVRMFQTLTFDYGDRVDTMTERVNENTLDNPQHGISLGAQYRFGAYHVGLSALYIHLVEQSVDKVAAGFEPDDEARPQTELHTTMFGYPGYTYGGFVAGAMLQAGIDF
jgi:long-subunit fatty acid transport protein